MDKPSPLANIPQWERGSDKYHDEEEQGDALETAGAKGWIGQERPVSECDIPTES